MAMCPYLKHLLISRRIQHIAATLHSVSSVQPLLGSPYVPHVTPSCKIHCNNLSSTTSFNHKVQAVGTSTCPLKPKLSCLRYPVNISVERTIFTTRRCYKRKKQTAADEETDEDTDDEVDERDTETDDDDDDDDDLTDDEDESGVPKDYKDIHHNLSSLRIDAVLSKGLNVSRKKIEDEFLSTKLRLNGNVVTKKGKQVKVGDTLDLIRGSSDDGQDDMVSVMRLVVKKVYSDKTSKGNTRVVLRRWKNLKVPKSEL